MTFGLRFDGFELLNDNDNCLWILLEIRKNARKLMRPLYYSLWTFDSRIIKRDIPLRKLNK